MTASSPIALLTDFGLTDPYVGQLRAALTRLAPQSNLLDISHNVEPFGTGQAAFFLAASAPHFPADAVFLCVVDPGVGSGRALIGAELGGQRFLAPDSGLLGLLLSAPGADAARIYDLSATAGTYQASATFHGRDIFAPLAARLATGEPLAALGEALDQSRLVKKPWAAPTMLDGALLCHVLHVDRFGNCVLSLRQDHQLPAEVTGHSPSPGERHRLRLVRTYAQLAPGEGGALGGSQGFYELAANMGSAERLLTLRPGDDVRLLFGEAF
jgi:S-adenosyl-L-methionine hydrolase (adenosine-forming)